MADTGSEASRAVALDLLACMAEQDWDRMYSRFLTDESTWTMIAPGAQPLRGRKIADFFASGGAMFEGGAPTVTVTATTAEEGRVAIEAVGDGRLRNGRTYANRYHMLMEIRDDRVHAIREYMDSAHVAEVFASTEVETG